MSATGPCNKPYPHHLPAGFTLLEMLVVIVIIGVVLTFAVLTIGGDRRGEELGREARQFAELLRLAGEQTVMRGEEWGVEINADGYRFLVYADQGWTEQEGDDLFRARPLTEGTELQVELEGRDIVLGATKTADAAEDADKEDGDALKPTLFILSSGEISPFIARFTAKDTEQRFDVKADARGDLTVETPEP